MLLTAAAGATLVARIPIDYLSLRYDGVTEQTSEYTCGAASVATMLTYFYSISTSEADVLELIYASMRARGEQPTQGQGFTAYDLKEALAARGVTSKGFLVKPAALQNYFARGGLPVIIYLAKPQKHFEVAVGMIEDQIVLADPSWGRSVAPLIELVNLRGYSGVVLVPIPSATAATHVAASQKDVISWARHQLARLGRLRDSLP